MFPCVLCVRGCLSPVFLCAVAWPSFVFFVVVFVVVFHLVFADVVLHKSVRATSRKQVRPERGGEKLVTLIFFVCFVFWGPAFSVEANCSAGAISKFWFDLTHLKKALFHEFSHGNLATLIREPRRGRPHRGWEGTPQKRSPEGHSASI